MGLCLNSQIQERKQYIMSKKPTLSHHNAHNIVCRLSNINVADASNYVQFIYFRSGMSHLTIRAQISNDSCILRIAAQLVLPQVSRGLRLIIKIASKCV